MDAEERVSAQDFDIPVIEVKRLMRGYTRGVDERLVVGRIWYRGVDGRLVIRTICDGEVGESGDTGGRGLSGDAGGWRPRDRGWRGCVLLWGCERIEWRGLGDLMFEVSARKSERRGDRSRSRVPLARISRFWLPRCKCRRRREPLPAAFT